MLLKFHNSRFVHLKDTCYLLLISTSLVTLESAMLKLSIFPDKYPSVLTLSMDVPLANTPSNSDHADKESRC
ncbi:hypothetical protein Mapa_016057 [Marchantia paleacea]|nr:hypothetical protein Mapa_016057 [Marchantia paleacea]